MRKHGLVRSPAEDAASREIVGVSPLFLAEVNKLQKVALAEATVLILGETGTGKEVFARAIHDRSSHAAEPFVAVNCAAIPLELLDNELFGHRPGAFTGATSASSGIIAQAHRGTLFLDEIDALPLTGQAKLLRVLQEREFRPLGSAHPVKADMRVIVATNANLREMVETQQFRRDLFYRMNVVSLTLPPLRRRTEDIPLLARHFLSKFSHHSGGSEKELTASAVRKLLGYDWPGNVRELQNVMQQAVIFSEGRLIDAKEIRLDEEQLSSDPNSFQACQAAAAKVYKDFLRRLLIENDGNISQAAVAGKISRRHLFRLLRKHQIAVCRARPTLTPQKSSPISPKPPTQSPTSQRLQPEDNIHGGPHWMPFAAFAPTLPSPSPSPAR